VSVLIKELWRGSCGRPRLGAGRPRGIPLIGLYGAIVVMLMVRSLAPSGL
jgi:hypothetical protein